MVAHNDEDRQMTKDKKLYQTTDCWRKILSLVFPEKPKFSKLTFTYPAWLKLQCYINLIGDYEITGFGRIVDNHIVDIKIIPQTVKSAEVDCDIDAMVDFIKQVPVSERGQWILDWHSHVNMGVFMSGTDSKNYEEQFEARLNQQFPVMIVNKRGEVWCNNYMETGLKPIEVTIDKDSIPMTRETLLELYNECDNEVQNKCKKKEYSTRTRWSYLYDKDSKDKDDDDYDYNSWYSSYQDDRYNTPTYKKKEDEKVSTVSDSDDHCLSCGTYLVNADEYDRLLCDDCWEKMTPTEQMNWIESLRK